MDLVFLDANVLFSAAWLQTPEMRALWRVRGAALRTSEYAIDEVRRNLLDHERLATLDRLLRDVEVVEAPPVDLRLPHGIGGLPADDVPILLAAAASRSTHLLTGNTRDFDKLYGRTVAGVLVLRPRAYLDLARGP